MANTNNAELTYSLPGVSCAHCVATVTDEVERVSGVEAVAVDLACKSVTVTGESLDDAKVRAAIDAAGYDIAS